MKTSILLVEDDINLASVLKDYFEENGINVHHTPEGEASIEIMKKLSPHLILLDIKLPDIDGFEVIKEIRKINKKVPVIMLSGKMMHPEFHILGYELGAINYLRKPVNTKVLLAQIKSVLNLYESKHQVFMVGQNKISVDLQIVKINDDIIKLREKDAKALCFFLENPESVIRRHDLLKLLYYDDSHSKNSLLDCIISRLRKELSPYGFLQIESIYGTGYVLKLNQGEMANH